MKSSLSWFLRLCNTVLWTKGPMLFGIIAAFFALPNWNIMPIVGNFPFPVTSSLWHSLFNFLMLRTSALSYEWQNAVFFYDWFIVLNIIFIVSIKGYNFNSLNAGKTSLWCHPSPLTLQSLYLLFCIVPWCLGGYRVESEDIPFRAECSKTSHSLHVVQLGFNTHTISLEQWQLE